MENASEVDMSSVLFTTLNGHSVTLSSLALNIVFCLVGFFILTLNAIVLDTLVKRTSLECTDLLMCHLAVTDLMTGVLLLHNVLYRVVYFLDPTECLIRLGGTIIFVASSVYHLTLLTVDRFVKIVFPYRYPDIITKRSVAIMSSAVWIFSVSLGFLPVYGWNSTPQTGDPPCSLVTVMPAEFTGLALAVFYIPVFVIGLMYYRIFMVARRHTRAIAALDVNARREVNNFKYAKTVLLLIGSYLITLLPLGLFLTVYISGGFPDMTTSTAHSYTIYTSVMTFSNSLVNPIIYTFKVPPIRRRFLAMLGKS